MINLLKFKELLGEEAQGLTDTELESIRDAQYQFARLAFQKLVSERFMEKKLSKND